MALFSTATSQPVAKFSFNRDFQVQLLGLLYQDYEFLNYSVELINPDYFADKILVWYFNTIKNYFIDYQGRIDEVSLKNELKKTVLKKKIKEEDIQPYLKVFKYLDKPVLNKTYIIDEVATFCQHQAIRKAALKTPTLLAADDIDALKEMWKETFEVGVLHEVGTEYFLSYPERIRRRAQVSERKIMPTGITELDIWLGGGLKPKQLGLWMAPTNRGKTLALMHCAKRAIVSGKKVLHYTLELSEDEVSERYDSVFSKIPMQVLTDRESDLLENLNDAGRRWGNSLIVKEFPTKKVSVAGILAHCKGCMQMGFIPDLVIVDYLNLVKPPNNRKNKREELTDTAEELRGAASETGVPWWSATQSRRGAISMETHGEEEVGEDIGMINTSDVTITLNQTEEELFQEIMRCFIAKNRNGPRYRTAKIATKFERMCFYDPIATAALATSSAPSINTTSTPASSKSSTKKKSGKSYSPVTGGLVRT